MRDVLTFVALYMPRTADASTSELPAFLVPDAEAVRLLSASPNGLAVPTRANLVGIGHSIGGETMVGVALHAPELFCSIAVIEPIILDADTYPFGTSLPLARFALKKEWRWKSSEEAEKHFAEHPVYGRYRQDVRQAFLVSSPVVPRGAPWCPVVRSVRLTPAPFFAFQATRHDAERRSDVESESLC